MCACSMSVYRMGGTLQVMLSLSALCLFTYLDVAPEQQLRLGVFTLSPECSTLISVKAPSADSSVSAPWLPLLPALSPALRAAF